MKLSVTRRRWRGGVSRKCERVHPTSTDVLLAGITKLSVTRRRWRGGVSRKCEIVYPTSADVLFDALRVSLPVQGVAVDEEGVAAAETPARLEHYRGDLRCTGTAAKPDM